MQIGEHINTYEKGMTSDVNVLYQPNGTYRYMKNCQLISQDGNNYTIKDCLGNVRVFAINIPFKSYTTGPTVITRSSAKPMPIGFISFPDRLIVLSTNAEGVDGNGDTVGGYGEIGEIRYTDYGEGIQPIIVSGNDNDGYVPLYNHIDLDFSKLQRIEGFAFEENDGIQRIYWTDNFNEPRVFNVADPIFSTYIASGSLVDGTSYMVIQGLINYNGTVYGPNDASGNVLANVFTANATNTYTNLTGTTPSPLVIEYFPIQLLNFTPSRSMGNMKFLKYGTGTVYCGAKIYFYRLTKPSEGIQTSWSYGSSPIHVGTINDVVSVPANSFFDFTGGGTSVALEISGKSVFITIDNIDLAFTNIEVAVAEYNQSLETISGINMIASDLITSTSMTFEHTGGTPLAELTQGEITLFPASILRCKTMTTNKNYILIGNTSERDEFQDFDITNVAFTQIQHKMRAHQSEYGGAATAQVCENILSYNLSSGTSNITPDATANPANVNGIPPYTQWVVTVGTATYNAVAYTVGQVFQGVPGVYNWANTSGTAQIRPCVFKNKYTTQAAVKRPDYIQFDANNSDQWTYRNPAVASHVKGHWSAETYRYGIMFFDLKGNPFYVRWIGDFTFDTVANVPLMELVQVNSGGDDDWYLNQNGVSIDGIEIPASLIDKISGFSIVRAERDAKIFTQGMLMQVGGDASVTSFPLPSPHVLTNTYSFYANDRTTLYTYVCPDKLVNYPVENYNSSGNLKTSHWLVPRSVGGYIMKSSSDGDEALETKYFEQAAAEATPPPAREYTIAAIADLTEDQLLTSFGSVNAQIWNRTRFVNAPAAIGEASCVLPFTVADLDNCQAIGGPKSIIETGGDTVWGYNGYNTIAYGNLTAAANEKMIANVFVDKTNLYGGQSAAALASTFYISIGHFQPITASVKTDTFNGVDKYIFNQMEIWGGDCYNCLATYGASLYDIALPNGTNYDSYSWGIKFACQCNSNYDLRRGRLVEAVRMTTAGTLGGSTVGYNPVRLEGFSYNKGYSSQGLAFLYPALPVNFAYGGQYPFRVRFAGQKVLGEVVDSFRNFAILDFKDMGAQSGEVNNLKTKNDRTVVWQNKAVNTVPILERQVVTPQTGDDVSIGTGGVVDRFDVLSNYYGNQHQWSVVETEFGFIWFDMRRKAVVVLGFGGDGIIEVSYAEGLKGFFDEIFLEVAGSLAPVTDLLNSQTFEKTSDRPLVGVGITGVYEPKFKTSHITFKFIYRDVSGGAENFLNKDFTILYHHLIKAFIGFTDCTPAIWHNHNQTVFAANNPKNKLKAYNSGMASTTFTLGDVVMYGTTEYMFTSTTDITIATYPGTAPQIPDAVGSIYWTAINNTNELWVSNQPSSITNPAPDYLYNSFFGQVITNELWDVVNPKTQNAFNVLNMEQHGNRVNVTTVTTSADNNQSATDASITSVNNNYRNIYDAVCSSMPLQSNGSRITGMYLLRKLIKKNWTTNPRSVSTSVRILQFIKSRFQEKR